MAEAKAGIGSWLDFFNPLHSTHLSSPRQFSRAFRFETSQSPAKAVENLRVEAARLMMEQSRHPIDIIARQTGFPIATACAEPSCAPSDSRRS